MTFFKRIIQAALVAAFFLSPVQAQSPDYIRHPSSMPCLFIGMPGSTSGTQASCGSNAAADGTTKGIATFTAADFDSSAGLISIDYTNGQAADATHKGFLTSTDWSSFNGKQAAGNYITGLTGDVTASGPGSVPATVTKINGATLGTTTATSGNVLIGSGTSWVTNALSGDLTITSTGVGTAASTIQRTYYAASTSGTTTYTATLSPVPTAYVTGAQYVFTVTSTNTGAVTMNFNSLGAKTVQLNGGALGAGQLPAGITFQSIYDGTNLQITGQSGATTSPLTTNGDTFVYGTGNTRLPKGAEGQVYVTDSSGTPNVAWANSTMDLRYGLFGQDDFTNSTPSGTQNSLTIDSFNGTGAQISSRVIAGGTGHQGVIALTTGSTSTGSGRLSGAMNITGNGGTLTLGDGTLEVVWIFKTPAALSDGTNRYAIYCGMNGSSATGAFTDGAAFNYQDNVNGGKSTILVHVAGAQQTVANGGITIAVSNWYRERLVFDAARSKVDMYIRDETANTAEVLDVTYTGSLPASSIGLGVVCEIRKILGTSVTPLPQFDGWQYTYRLTNQR